VDVVPLSTTHEDDPNDDDDARRPVARPETLAGLRGGLLLSILVIFLLLAANFQSFRLAVAVISVVPAVICGVLLMLLVTGTTLNVQSFMGAIMAIGISVANAILLVTFAENARAKARRFTTRPWRVARAACAPF
jgi:multidrug efflux pump subunit AcrB